MTNEYSLEYTKEIMTRVVDLLARDRRSLSQLAKQLGLNKSTVHRYKKGERSMSVYRVKEIADVLGVPVSSLLPEHEDSEG